jgi:hypothetical protein
MGNITYRKDTHIFVSDIFHTIKLRTCEIFKCTKFNIASCENNAQEWGTKLYDYEYTVPVECTTWTAVFEARLRVIATVENSFLRLANVSAFNFSVIFGTFL